MCEQVGDNRPEDKKGELKKFVEYCKEYLTLPLFLVLLSIYIVAHFFWPASGKRIKTLSRDQLYVVESIISYRGSEIYMEKVDIKKKIDAFNDSELKSICQDDSLPCLKKIRIAYFLTSTVGLPLDSIKGMLKNYNTDNLGEVLRHFRYEEDYFFWLYGTKRWVEVFFWAAFGSLTILLLRNSYTPPDETLTKVVIAIMLAFLILLIVESMIDQTIQSIASFQYSYVYLPFITGGVLVSLREIMVIFTKKKQDS